MVVPLQQANREASGAISEHFDCTKRIELPLSQSARHRMHHPPFRVQMSVAPSDQLAADFIPTGSWGLVGVGRRQSSIAGAHGVDVGLAGCESIRIVGIRVLGCPVRDGDAIKSPTFFRPIRTYETPS